MNTATLTSEELHRVVKDHDGELELIRPLDEYPAGDITRYVISGPARAKVSIPRFGVRQFIEERPGIWIEDFS